MAKIAIIGSGYIGETVGKGLIGLGNEVIFFDVVDKKLPNFTKNITEAVEKSDISFLCVPTPTEKGKIDLSFLKDDAEEIGKALKSRQSYYLVVVKSTVIPTTTEDVVIPILNKYKKVGEELGVCMNPEFITQSSHMWTDDAKYVKGFANEDRIVIGEYDKKSGDILANLYKPLNMPIYRTDPKTAEMIKYASNCMLAAKISYWNEIFLICKKLGVNSQTVADIASLDPRIGKYGSVHGKAFGGACLPKDLKAFINFAKKRHNVKLIKAVDEVNEAIKKDYGVRE